MRAITWFCRLGVIALAAALLFGAVIVAIAPRVWGIANSWEGQPLSLPGLPALARPTRVYDADGTLIAFFQRQNSQPVALADIPRGRPPRLHRRRGPRVLLAQRRQCPQPRPRRAVERRLRQPAAGRLDDHDAGRQERVPRRDRARLPLQGAADPLRDDAGEQVHQGSDPRALPQHRLLRQQRLRRAGGGGGVLRQDRRPADVRRGGVPRRPRAFAVRLRPDRQPRAQPRPLRPGRRPPRRFRRDDRGRGAVDARHVRDPGAAAEPPGRPTRPAAYVLHRGAARLPAQSQHDPRLDVRAARGGALPRRSGDPHDADPRLPADGRAGPRRPPRHATGLRRGDRLAQHADRGDRGDGRRPRFRAGRERGQHGALAAPDRLEPEDLHPRLPRCRRGRCPTT